MTTIIKVIIKASVPVVVSLSLVFTSVPALAYASSTYYPERDQTPTASLMLVDAVVARPLLFVGTVVSSSIFVLSLPFSLLGGNVDEAWTNLVSMPAGATFTRCLGCTFVDSEGEL